MAYVGLTRHTHSVNYYVPKDTCKNMAQLKWSASREGFKGSTIHYTHDLELAKEAAQKERAEKSEELGTSDSWLNVSKSIAMDASAGIKGFFYKRAQRIQDKKLDKSFYEFQEKEEKVSLRVQRFEEPLNKDEITAKAIKAIEKQEGEKILMKEELKIKEIGEKLEKERQTRAPNETVADPNLKKYWSQVFKCKELQTLVDAEKEGGLKDLESSKSFKKWQAACARRNTLAYELDSSSKSSLHQKAREVFELQASKHASYLKEQELKKSPDLGEHLRFNIEPLLSRLFPDGPTMKTASAFRFGSKGSFSVTHSGEKAGQFYDFENREGGGVLKLIEHRLGMNRKESVEWAKEFLNIAPSLKISETFQKPLKEEKTLSNWHPKKPPVHKLPPTLKELKLDKHWNEAMRHEYRDREGNLLYQVLRLQDPNNLSKKITPPLSYGHYADEEKLSWQLKGYKDETGRNSLYGLEKLDKNPKATVVIVEGEKAADLGGDKFLQKEKYVCLSWAGGARSVSKADWSPLEGRKVLVWGDNDEAGRKAQSDVCKELKKLDHIAVKAIDHTMLKEKNFSEKWDLADPLPKNCSEMTIQILKDKAVETIGSFDQMDRFYEKQVIQEKIDLAEKQRIVSGKSGLYGIEKVFENERTTVVLVSSPEAADKGADHFLIKEDHVCVSWNGGAKGAEGHSHENEIDFSALEGRKVLVWGDHDDTGKEVQKDICEQLKEYDNMAVKAVNHDLMDQKGIIEGWSLADDFSKASHCGFYTCTYLENDADKVVGEWRDIDDKYRELDKELGLDKDRGLER